MLNETRCKECGRLMPGIPAFSAAPVFRCNRCTERRNEGLEPIAAGALAAGCSGLAVGEEADIKKAALGRKRKGAAGAAI